MTRRVLVPEPMRQAAEALRLSPATVAGGLVFLTGVTGVDASGAMPQDPAAQFRNAFGKIGTVLAAGGLGFDSIVEMTSYHLRLRETFDLFAAVRADHVAPPWPAWTAVEVAGLRREGALVEIRVVAALDG